MSLQLKIKESMDALAIRIIRKAEKSNDEKLRQMVEAYWELARLLKLAEGIEQ